MRQVFEVFKANFENRYQEVSVLNMGEDSVRYDFFNAISIQHLNILVRHHLK